MTIHLAPAIVARISVNGQDAGRYLIRLGLAQRWQ